ncbi:lytic transglycosylase domain-containing protein [Sphingomonas sp. BK235]|uniref:lytic transglycosylase domain-containing protein n=1 Tax=Sphingomonas sp. BK235 TaxID=2512131 RepID=UPI0010D29768|nr:lytic transglycosylase domain-containing protein [Sphingomonas sp. BK235]TCP32771.1 soluble lytic murein transglycosylase-like protein [Sphingomonas sp. BK235]
MSPRRAALAVTAALAATAPALAAPPLPLVAPAAPAPAAVAGKSAGIPAQLTPEQRSGYRAVFAAIRDGRWSDAQITLDTMASGPLHAYARAELVLAKGSPRVGDEALTRLIAEAPELPQAEALMRLASARGLSDLPALPSTQRLIWQDGAPARVRARATRSDQVAADLAQRMQPYVKADMGAEAQALLESTDGLSPEAETEWQARVAWIYFLQGLDPQARALAAKAAAGSGDWALHGRWTEALSAWRQHDCAATQVDFENVAARATDTDLRATALYWAARSDMACGRPDRVEARLKTAAQYKETFYGLLARQALGLPVERVRPELVSEEWARLERRPNVRVAAALAELGEGERADAMVRQQARIGDPSEFGSLVHISETLDLPATTVWLAHNMPQGAVATADTRYPMPNWTPDTGWRIDKALVYAHTLQESGFRNKVRSPAGAFGLMQIMPAAATDYMRERGVAIDQDALARPSTNIDIGQRHIEKLRDMGLTGGLLPKVIAAYNAGPKPVGEWNAIVRDGGDPLLYIESIPYWETRGYVVTVLRNYWMYESLGGKAKSPSRVALAQGMWPRFPGLPGDSAVRMTSQSPVTAIAINGTVAAQSTTHAER